MENDKEKHEKYPEQVLVQQREFYKIFLNYIHDKEELVTLLQKASSFLQISTVLTHYIYYCDNISLLHYQQIITLHNYLCYSDKNYTPSPNIPFNESYDYWEKIYIPKNREILLQNI